MTAPLVAMMNIPAPPPPHTHTTQFFTPTGQPSGLGEYVLLEYQLQYDFWWVWLGLGFIIIVWTVMMFIPPLVFEALAEPRKQLVISDDNPFEPKSLTQVCAELDASYSPKTWSRNQVNPSSGSIPCNGWCTTAPTPPCPQVPIDEDPKAGVKGVAAAATAAKASAADDGAKAEAKPVEAPKAEKEMALPFEQMSLVFRNIDYYVPMPGGKRGEELQLLKKCWGAFKPGVCFSMDGCVF